MNDDAITILGNHNIHPYGSEELTTFEQHMTRYFEREYQRWQGNNSNPEDYGVNSFAGKISHSPARHESLQHYNNEYQVFRAFLDKTYMAYTAGFYGATNESPVTKDISLEKAQENKYRLIIERAGLEDGQKVLDLGCGFGGFSKFLLREYPDITVIGINPSDVQVKHIREELIDKDKDFDNSRFRLIHAYFDDLAKSDIEDNYFDRVFSAGLLEHITNIDLLQKNISRLLKEGGKCLHHCIVSLDTIPNFLNSEDTHMGHYYPGAHIWPFNEPKRHNTHMRFIEGWFVNGMNYWYTLDVWHRRFWDAIDELYPEYLSAYEVEDWNRYFVLCKAMFRPNDGKSYGNGQFLYIKP
ncbi:MAG: class I SAM-dependent methyltransferase, partial [Gammaproteobacteria bacterium]|jgi:cyclopropane-fatty-acyl-phospholipid synthase